MAKSDMSKKRVAEIALRVVRKFLEKQRPTAILVTFELKSDKDEDSRFRDALVKYLEEDLDGVKVATSSYAIPSNNPLNQILAKIEKITEGSIIVYAFPFRTWEGSGNLKTNEWLDEYVPKVASDW